MGFKKSYDTGFGIMAPNAYYRIRDVHGDSSGSISYNMEIFYDRAAKDAGKNPLKTIRRQLPGTISGRFGIAHEIYQTIKQDPEYAGAEDIFEDGDFAYLQNHYFSNAYILKATLTSGSLVNNELNNAIINGKCLIDDQIVYGEFVGINAKNVLDDGYGNLKGFVEDGYADGYVVQLLIL